MPIDISYDDYIRTTEPRHHRAVQEFLQRVYDSGDIELDSYEGLYCVGCELYYKEDELVDGLCCPIHGTAGRARHRGELLLPALARTRTACSTTTPSIPEAVQPAGKRNEVLGLIKQGLLDFSISRTSISWGIPLPWDTAHVAYVWFDALINYCTAVGYPDDRTRFDRYWPANYHLIGKDILRQHAVYWPAMLMAAGEAPPQCVFAHGYLLVGGEKMSKTKLNQIAPADLVGEFGVDGFRYHFLADQRFGPDGDFSYEAMVARYNADLANNFGNLANRVLNMAVGYCDGVVPATRANGPLVAAAETAFAVAHRAARRTRLLGRLRRGVGSDPRRQRLHRRAPAVGAQQGGRRRSRRRGAGRLPRSAADRRAARIAGDPAGRGRAVAPPRAPRAARGPVASPRRRRVGPAPGRLARWRRARRSSRASST